MMTYSVKQTAAKLCVGRNKLLAHMRENGWLHSTGNLRNSATKYACTSGLVVPELTKFNKGPVVVLHSTIRITAKGLAYLSEDINAVDPINEILPSEPVPAISSKQTTREQHNRLHRLEETERTPLARAG